MNEWKDEWIDEWMDEWINKWANEWMIEKDSLKKSKVRCKNHQKELCYGWMDGSNLAFFNYLRAPGKDFQEPLTIILVIVCRMTVSRQQFYSLNNNKAEKTTIESWF